MERTKLISIRLPIEIVSALDDLTQRASYLNRSFVINHVLTACLFCGKENALQRILNTYDPVSDGVNVYVRVEKQRPTV